MEQEVKMEELEKEEKQIKEENKKNDDAIQRKMEEKAQLDKELMEQRHKRLMHLLTKSQFYSQHLWQKIENWNAKKSVVKNKRKRLKTDNKENSGSQNSNSKNNPSDENGNLCKNSDKKMMMAALERIKSNKEEEDDATPTQESPPQLFEGGTLRSYQLYGYSWLKTLYENGINGILADEMGLGKTVQCIALVSHLVYMGISGPFLVVAPLSTLPNWIAEFRRFAPRIPTLLYHGDEKTRKEKRSLLFQPVRIRDSVIRCRPVVITSYEVAIKDANKMAGVLWRYLIVDEGHRIKNHNCRLSRCLRNVKTQNRLILTGTPLQNNLAELWSLLNFLLPEIFDNLDVFESWFEVDSLLQEGGDQRIVQQERDKQILSTLHKILTPFLLRRMKKDIDLDIPLKKELLVYVPMTKLQLDLYKATITRDFSYFQRVQKPKPDVVHEADGRPRRRSRKTVQDLSILFSEDDSEAGLERYAQEAAKRSHVEALAHRLKSRRTSVVNVKFQNVMMQCRKVVNHPYLLEYPLTAEGEFKIDEDLLKCSGKLLVLDQLLKELYRTDHKVLIFSQMTKVLDIIEDFLTLRPQYNYKRLDGSVTLEDRSADITEFNQREDLFLFLLSTRAGGLGINLTSADTVIIYDSDWNPQQDLQAQDRCHRIGQTRPVLILRFVTSGTIDQRIVERAAAKRKLEKVIMRADKFKSTSFLKRKEDQESDVFNPDELMKLLHSTDHDRVYKASNGDGVYTQEELDLLLDRTDLKRASEKNLTKEELEGVFKTIPEAPADCVV